MGTTQVGFLRYPRRRQELPSLGTIVAVEGGPGYSTIASRWYYRDLYKPLLDRRELLLVDLRGTGRSDAIDCPQLQSYRGPWKRLVALCGRQLGPLSERYGSAFAAADLVVVIDALGIDRIDIYGDSYGTFPAQTFAVRYPERTPNRHARRRLHDRQRRRVVARREPGDRGRVPGDLCARSRLCRARPRSDGHDRAVGPTRRCRARRRGCIQRRRASPLRTRQRRLGDLARHVGRPTPTIYRELVAAARAALRANPPDPAPLLRLAAENAYVGGAGNIHTYSEGLATATGCNDYPQLWDLGASMPDRVSQYRAALDELRRNDPDAFAPFAIDDWVVSSATLFTSCIRWPVPMQHVHAKPPGAAYPEVPVLVLNGDLDSLTSPEGAQAVAGRFPNATYVEVPNTTHVTALGDLLDCTSRLVLDFVQTRVVGDPSCVRSYPPIRLADRFPTSAAGLGTDVATRAALVTTGMLGVCWPDGGAWAGHTAWDCEAARSRPTASASRYSGCATSAGWATSPWANAPLGSAVRRRQRHRHAPRETGYPGRGCASAGTPGIP